MGDIGRMLVFVGGLLLVIGLVLILAGKINLPIGRLPGDIVYRGKTHHLLLPPDDLHSAERDPVAGAVCGESDAPVGSCQLSAISH